MMNQNTVMLELPRFGYFPPRIVAMLSPVSRDLAGCKKLLALLSCFRGNEHGIALSTRDPEENDEPMFDGKYFDAQCSVAACSLSQVCLIKETIFYHPLQRIKEVLGRDASDPLWCWSPTQGKRKKKPLKQPDPQLTCSSRC